MNSQPRKVSVIAPARLHLGFIDLSGSLGRHFGSIGITINEISTRLTLRAAPQLKFSGLASPHVEKYVRRLCHALNVSEQIHIEIKNLIPEHVGLGSGTQMALAIGMALNAFYELQLTVRDIAHLTGRGARSGIGIGAFEYGGLLVDGGRGELTLTPPLIAHLKMPENWRFILVFDRREQGFYGEQELNAFQQLPHFPRAEAERLSYLLLMQALPAVAEGELEKFGEVITQLQVAVGQHFAIAQGGIFTSQPVAEVMAWLQQQGAVAIGQTSWGPTGFCAVANSATAQQLLVELSKRFAHFSELSFQIVSVQNCGASVNVH